MSEDFYQSYTREYRNAIDLIKTKKAGQGQRITLNDDVNRKLSNLKELMKTIATCKLKQIEVAKLEDSVKLKSEQIQKTTKDIETHKKRCYDKQTRIMHWAKVINLFKKEFNEEFKLNEKK